MSTIAELIEAVRCSSIPEMQKEEIAEILVEREEAYEDSIPTCVD